MSKKIISIILVLTTVLALGLVGCQSEDTSDDAYESIDFSVGLVTDVGGIDDKSFNQGTWEGIQMFAEDTGAEIKALQSETDSDYIPNLSTFSDDKYDLIVAPGYLFAESIETVAGNYPDQNYLIIDMVVVADNVASAVFSAEEGSFLAGVAAALKAQEAGKDTVGFLGGMEGEIIYAFEAGFEAGVLAIDPDMTILVEYAGSYTDTQIAQTKAAKMYDEGAYAIYQAAGNAGNGVIKEAINRRISGEDVWAIGVDKDQYDSGMYDDEHSAILTSMMKRVDLAAYDVANSTLNGEFPGGEILVYNLANGGVSLPDENPNLSDEILAQVDEYKEKVLSGEIVVPTVPSRIE
jgi:basic membrane protein A